MKNTLDYIIRNVLLEQGDKLKKIKTDLTAKDKNLGRVKIFKRYGSGVEDAQAARAGAVHAFRIRIRGSKNLDWKTALSSAVLENEYLKKYTNGSYVFLISKDLKSPKRNYFYNVWILNKVDIDNYISNILKPDLRFDSSTGEIINIKTNKPAAGRGFDWNSLNQFYIGKSFAFPALEFVDLVEDFFGRSTIKYISHAKELLIDPTKQKELSFLQNWTNSIDKMNDFKIGDIDIEDPENYETLEKTSNIEDLNIYKSDKNGNPIGEPYAIFSGVADRLTGNPIRGIYKDPNTDMEIFNGEFKDIPNVDRYDPETIPFNGIATNYPWGDTINNTKFTGTIKNGKLWDGTVTNLQSGDNFFTGTIKNGFRSSGKLSNTSKNILFDGQYDSNNQPLNGLFYENDKLTQIVVNGTYWNRTDIVDNSSPTEVIKWLQEDILLMLQNNKNIVNTLPTGNQWSESLLNFINTSGANGEWNSTFSNVAAAINFLLFKLQGQSIINNGEIMQSAYTQIPSSIRKQIIQYQTESLSI